MTISHVIYLEFARLIVSWQWVTEVQMDMAAQHHERPSPSLISGDERPSPPERCANGAASCDSQQRNIHSMQIIDDDNQKPSTPSGRSTVLVSC